MNSLVTKTLPVFVGASLCVGCMAQSDPVEGEPQLSVVRDLVLARTDDGTSHGFDLDGVVTDSRDPRGCYQKDYMSPDGRPGVDNQFADLLPLFDIVGEGALEAFVKNAIDEGRLLMMPEIQKHGDRYNLVIRRGDDVPLLGTDDKLLENQTLALSTGEDRIMGQFEGAEFDGDVLRAGPFDFVLPIVVFELLYEIPLQDAMFEIRFDENGVGHGVVAGATPIPAIEVAAVQAGSRAGFDIIDLLGDTLYEIADLQLQNGRCHALSLSATFETVPAFTY